MARSASILCSSHAGLCHDLACDYASTVYSDRDSLDIVLHVAIFIITVYFCIALNSLCAQYYASAQIVCKLVCIILIIRITIILCIIFIIRKQ